MVETNRVRGWQPADSTMVTSWEDVPGVGEDVSLQQLARPPLPGLRAKITGTREWGRLDRSEGSATVLKVPIQPQAQVLASGSDHSPSGSPCVQAPVISQRSPGWQGGKGCCSLKRGERSKTKSDR